MINNLFNSSKYSNFLKFSSAIILSLYIVTFCLRFFELIQMVWVKPLSDNSLNAELMGIISDLGAFSAVAIILYLIGFLFSWHKIAYKSVLITLSTIYVFINLSTVLFFLTALVPMDQSMFTYSVGEMVVIVNSTQLGLTGILFIILPIIIFSASLFFLQKKNLPVWLPLIFIVSWIGAKPIASNFITNEGNLHNRRLVLNKADYFLSKSIQHFQIEEQEEKEKIVLNTQNQFLQFRKEDNFYQKVANSNNIPEIEGVYLDQYPLLHKNNYNPLKDYFGEIREKPNVVFILVESLGQRFFDKKRDPICFTPFLDSLKGKSLYWNNCFSSSERTFGVLPSVLGSLPYGKKGFNELPNMPDHLSLTNILKDNGYYSSFFYGGWIGFHGMERLLKKQKFDFLSYYYPSTYKRLAANENGFSWGYADHLMMKRSLFVVDSLQKSPMLNVYLTLSTHSPFDIPNRDKYEQYIKTQLETAGQKEKHEIILKNPDPFISIVYSDECIKSLFDEYKKRDLYDNTIFVITGDHVMHELGIESESEIYNIPLIIHSPLLTKTGQFTSVNSHHDIAPSLINLLKGNNVIKAPSIFNWMGYGLEPNNEKNRKFIPLMQNNKGIKACVYNNHFYSTDGELYEFEDAQHPIRSDNKEIQKEMKKRLKNFHETNEYLCLNNFVCPFDIAYQNQSFKLISQKKLFKNKNIQKEQEWTGDEFKFTLDTNYSDISFAVSFKISYADTLPNPNIGIRIYDKDDNYLDYFHLKNDLYFSSRHDINKDNYISINRLIPNKNNIFNEGNRIKFYIEACHKEFDIKEFRTIVKGIK